MFPGFPRKLIGLSLFIYHNGNLFYTLHCPLKAWFEIKVTMETTVARSDWGNDTQFAHAQTGGTGNPAPRRIRRRPRGMQRFGGGAWSLQTATPVTDHRRRGDMGSMHPMHQLHPGGKRSSQYHDGLGGREDVSLLVEL